MTLEMLNPAQLLTRAQVRTNAAADKALTADIKANGLIQPITAYRDQDGGVVVLAGHRRTLAALEAGLTEVPVYLVPQPSEADRITFQVAENVRRESLSTQDQAAALFDLTQHASGAQTAKRLHVSRDQVATVKAVMGNEKAATHFQESMNLEEAAVLAEFADDEEALEILEARDGWESITHVAERLRQKRATAAAVEAAAVEHAAAGRALITDSTEVNGYSEADALRALRIERANRADGTPATIEDANAVCITANYQGELTESPVITGWNEAGYTHQGGRAAVLAPTTEEEEAQAAEATAQRRLVVANNKAMEAAQVIRRKWLTQFLTSKTLPKDTAQFVAYAIASGNTTDPKAQSMAATLLGVSTQGYSPIREAASKMTKRPEAITLALAIGTIEGHLEKGAWRGASTDVRAYFARLIAWGYEASQVETETAQAPA